MEIRDPVHGSIQVSKEEIPIIRGAFFQRLRGIKQLGFSEYVFPGGTHTRFLHSIGVMHVGTMALEKLFKDLPQSADILRLKETAKLACLLHDVGHAPLSHSTEVVMPNLSALKIPTEFLSLKDRNSDRQATHEDYTIKAIADSSFADSFRLVEKKLGVERKYIADLIRGETHHHEYFTVGGVNYFPVLSQLVSSELDCDRMDYLLRDSYFCGVSYGSYDLGWILDNLKICTIDGTGYLGLNERAVVTFDDFLLSRYHMFVMVYFHYRAVCLEKLLYRYFATSNNEYSIPADIEKYIEHDDNYLMKVLRESSNPYAKQITTNQIPPKIFESFNDTQLQSLERIQKYLEDQNIEVIRCSSSSRLSKYYGQPGSAPKKSSSPNMYVIRETLKKTPSYSPINEVTDLYHKFKKSHAINRIHCDIDKLDSNQLNELMKLIEKEG